MLKLLCISIHTPNYSCLWITELLNMRGVQRWRRGCAHALEPPSGKNFNTVEAPNHIYSRTKFQLSNLISSWYMDRSPHVTFGLRSQVLDWIHSFVTRRTQSVSFAGTKSIWSAILCGVPQGRVLGPLLFILYAADVIAIAPVSYTHLTLPTILRV